MPPLSDSCQEVSFVISQKSKSGFWIHQVTE